MNKRTLLYRSLSVLGVVFLSCLFTMPSSAMSSQLSGSLVANAAVILNSGSTNTCAYTIRVSSTGSATYEVCQVRHGQGTLSPQLTDTFFRDLAMAQPFTALSQKNGCLRSISFSTKTYIEYKSQRSPDVWCSADERAQKLGTDTERIAKELQFNIMS
jgi:hypothetical protein